MWVFFYTCLTYIMLSRKDKLKIYNVHFIDIFCNNFEFVTFIYMKPINFKTMDTNNKVGNKIDTKEFVKTCKFFSIEQLHEQILRTGAIVMSWGFRNPVIMEKDQVYRFTVSGHHHKGHVYIVLDALDLFDIYYTSNRGTIKKVREGIYVDELINILDKDIEYIDAYSK